MNAAHPVTTLPALLPIGLAELGSEYAVPTPATPLHNLHWGAINDRYAATMGLTPTHFDDALLGVLGGTRYGQTRPHRWRRFTAGTNLACGQGNSAMAARCT